MSNAVIHTTTYSGICSIKDPYQDNKYYVFLPNKENYEKDLAAHAERQAKNDFVFDTNINSLADFEERYFWQIRPLSYEDHCEWLKTGVRPEVNYTAEYQKYLKTRGCANDEELQMVNKSGRNTMDELKEQIRDNLKWAFDGIGIQSHSDLNKKYVDYVMKNANIEDLFDSMIAPSVCSYDAYYMKMNGGYHGGTAAAMLSAEKFKELIQKLPKNPTRELDIDALMKCADKRLEQLTKQLEKELKGQYEFNQYKISNQEQAGTIFNKADNAKKVSAYNCAFSA